LKESTDLSSKNLWDLVDESSICALKALKIDTEFILKTHPATWTNSAAFHHQKTVISSLKVVNDVAERSVALMTMCNQSHRTHDETEMQKVIHVIDDNRHRISNEQKNTLKTYLTR
jgi:hypothetical protein